MAKSAPAGVTVEHTIGKRSGQPVAKIRPKKATQADTRPQPHTDVKGWVLCLGDAVIIVSPGKEYHGLFGKVDSFPSTQGDWSSYVHIDGRPTASGTKLLPNVELRWMGPDEAHIDQYRPTRPGERVRVVLDNEALASPEMKALEGKLGTVTELMPTVGGNSMVTVKLDDPAELPTAINSFDLLVVPIPVVHYVPEPERAAPVAKVEALASVLVATQASAEDVQRAGRRQEPVAPFAVAGQAAHEATATRVLDAKGNHLLEFDAVQVVPAHRKSLGVGSRTGFVQDFVFAAGKETEARVTFPGSKGSPQRDFSLIVSILERQMPVVASTPATASEPAPEVVPAPVASELPAEPERLSVLAMVQEIPLADIDTSRNYRKVFDDASLAELAQSIEAHGIMQAVLVRRTPAGQGSLPYQLVYGGRRYRGAQLAGLTVIPATVRELTDLQFAEAQLIENVQRQDVRPSDEAKAFNDLLNNHSLSPEEVALKVGRPVKFVLQRAKLVSLIPFWMELLEVERLPLVAAHALARIPPHSQVVVRETFENSWEMQRGGPLGASSIENAIQREVLRKLVSAAFPKDDATLCPGAGACVTCPKNSANHRGLFEDASDEAEAKCLDSACFAEKKAAYLERRLKEIAGTETLLISSSYDNPPAGALGYKFYDRAKEEDKGAVLALVVDGLDAGSMRWVKVSKAAPNAEAAAQEKKATRAAEIRQGKISETFRQLLAGHLYTSALGSKKVLETHLDYQIYSELRSQGGPHTVLRFALVEQMGWSMPEGGAAALKKLTPASNMEALQAWQKKNVSRLSYDEKLALYFALLGYNCSTFDSSNKRLQGYAQAAGANATLLLAEASAAVDNKGKTGEGKA